MKQSLMLTKNITATFTQTSGYIMRCILQAGTHLLHERIHELELTQTQWLTMVRLTIHGESTAAQLARGMMLDAATMMRILKYLEARGFIIRLRSKTDRRIINITLSTAGRSIARIIEREAFAMQEQLFTDLSAAERAQLFALLTRVQANSEALLLASNISLDR